MIGSQASLHDKLKQVHALRRMHQWYFGHIRNPLSQWKLVLRNRYRFKKVFSRVREKYGSRKLRVLFPIGNSSKWKVQSLYDIFIASGKYEPVVVVTPMDYEITLPITERSLHLNKVRDFLKKRDIPYVDAYDDVAGEFVPFRLLNPDIVWYTQPWQIYETQSPEVVSKFALCCYTPYYLQGYGCLDWECGILFMRLLWRNFSLSQDWASVCMEYQGLRRSGESVGLGHPMLDEYDAWVCDNRHHGDDGKIRVIYAPHWSCETGECFSTFLENGEKMLAFAKSHREIEWIFKPHPTLKHTLITKCGWSESKTEEYYEEWGKIGEACYDSNYVELFEESSALITDCMSFLIEYPCTGHPIIHLVSSKSRYQFHPISQRLFSTYYQAHNWDEFTKCFNMVVINGEDPRREERMMEVKRLRLVGNDAASNIIKYLDSEFTRK